MVAGLGVETQYNRRDYETREPLLLDPCFKLGTSGEASNLRPSGYEPDALSQLSYTGIFVLVPLFHWNIRNPEIEMKSTQIVPDARPIFVLYGDLPTEVALVPWHYQFPFT